MILQEHVKKKSSSLKLSAVKATIGGLKQSFLDYFPFIIYINSEFTLKQMQVILIT